MRRALPLVVIVTLATSCGSVVSVSGDYDTNEPIDLAPEQTLEVELESDRAVSSDPDAYDWVVVESGVLELVSEAHRTRPEPEDEFIGGYSRSTVFVFAPAQIGTADLVIDYVPVEGDDLIPASTFTVTIISKRD